MLNLKIPMGETLYWAERDARGVVRALGSVVFDCFEAGKVHLVLELPPDVEVERGAAREKRLERERMVHPPARRVNAGQRSKDAERQRTADVYCLLFENGKYIRTVRGRNEGPLTQAEATQHGMHWQSTSKGSRFRGYVISSEPKPVGQEERG